MVPDLIVGPLMEAWRRLSQTGNLLAVVDVSGSMATEVPGTGASRLDLSKQGLEAGITLTDPASSGGLWEFSTELDGSTDHRVLVPLGPLNEEVREVLNDVTRITGGKLYELERPEDIRDVFIDVQTGGVTE